MSKYLEGIAVIIMAGCLNACGSFPVNRQLDQFDKTAGYRFEQLKPGPNNTDSLFVVLTMSGGGTRAAALSYGVLDALRGTRITWRGHPKSLLEEVDVISSVSGGSFTAAYYALHRAEIFNGRFDQVFLQRNIQKGLLWQLWRPASWFKLAGRSYGRSDLSAEYYDRLIFKGATYQDLVAKAQRPFVIINATDMTLGAQFPFIQDQFDLLCSDLSQIPVARAVASSSAFPGLLTPLTFQNHAGQCGFRDDRWVGLAQEDRRENADRAIRSDHRRSYYQDLPDRPGSRRYIHLIDGGAAENIGLRGPMYAIRSTDPVYSILRKINNEEVDKLVVIVINAATDPDTKRDHSPRVPGLVDVLASAATVPLGNYSVDTVTLLKNKIAEFNVGYDYLGQCEEILQEKCPDQTLDPDLHPVDLYVIEIAFDFVSDDKDRHWFKNIGTSFSLPEKTINVLKRVGCTLFRDDPALKALLSEDGRSQEKLQGSAPVCPSVPDN